MGNKVKMTKSAGGVVINGEGKVLVVNQRGTSWSLPKGHLESGEDAITAARREVAEESGVSDLTLIRELGTYERYKIGRDGDEDYSELKAITMFLFCTTQSALRPTDPHNPEARWVAKDEVAALLSHPKDKEFFLTVVKEI